MATAQPSKGHFKDSYTLNERIGKGAYAVVYGCTQNGTGRTYAVKVVDKSKTGPKDIDDLAHEINIMDEIGYHPHVVQVIQWFSTERHLYIVMDMLNGGMLFDRIVQMKHYTESHASQLINNLLQALAHVHSKGIIHRDLKPENLLLRYAANDVQSGAAHMTDVCLADFGLAGYIPSTTCCGSPSYIAPEVINVGYYRSSTVPYNEKCDIWSLGVITYILISGKMPFHGANFKETFFRIVQNKWEFVGDVWKQVTPSAVEFIRLCLTPDPERRPSAKALLAHTWIRDAQPEVHLSDSLEGLRKFNAQQKMRAAVRVFCWTQSLLGRLDRTPPFMRYLRHEDIYSTIVTHQSQTDPKKAHQVDYGRALRHGERGWRMQDCCTCTSEMVCRHIQNVHEYLFVGKRTMDVFPFIDELKMMRAEAEADLAESPKDATAAEKLRKTIYSIEAACVFSDELAKVPRDNLKPNLMLDGSRNNMFRTSGGSRAVVDSEQEEVAKKLAERFRARKANEAKKAMEVNPAVPIPAAPSPLAFKNAENPATVQKTSSPTCSSGKSKKMGIGRC
ncbi:myosin light chain kinase [Strigomonas culicis]|uniref:Myosin light chain kinase n=1 Tax=Strigomonas culicis TaxID=28005 RepID=S9VKF3_9TRYP|nr:myosin light chain kinase [Strigomonas culicis]|eukprot:EPY27571.1 myosin light chain kinase [Strigomonas culicis]